MAQAKKTTTQSRARKKTTAAPAPAPKTYTRQIWAGVCIILGFFTLLAYGKSDGAFINLFADLIKGLFGMGFYFVAPALLIAAVILLFKPAKAFVLKLVSALLIPFLAGMLFEIFSKNTYKISFPLFAELWNSGKALQGGGVLSGFFAVLFKFLFSKVGAAIVVIVLTALALFILFGGTVGKLAARSKENREKRAAIAAARPEPVPVQPAAAPSTVFPLRTKKSAIDIPVDDEGYAEPPVKKKGFFNARPNVATPADVVGMPYDAPVEEAPAAPETPAEPAPAPVRARAPRKTLTPLTADEPKSDPSAEMEKLIEDTARRDLEEGARTYKFPPLNLLTAPSLSSFGAAGENDELRATKDRLELTLDSFGINAEISNIVHGPTVTRYEMALEAGVKLNKLTNLADDIALSLGVSGVRIAPIPNKISTVGIEVPNRSVSSVYLREIIASREFASAASKLTFAIGKNIAGEVVVGNIAKLPHLLIAGTTGSGKSVCLNSMILSIMYKSTPDEVKFIMVDPKMVEFKIYNGIPHLLVPVVTEAKKAAGALQWAVVEMMKRYRLFSESGARDLEGYNEIAVRSGEEKKPQIVVFIDELADLMLVSPKEVEEAICRVAQMGRAAGVHLVIATQSPRADVITGLMKANIPSRISFKVASALESRIILDAGGGADKLVGNGDMLYAPIGMSKPIRLQGAWVSDAEREKIVDYVKTESTASYDEEVIHLIDQASAEKGSGAGNAAPAEESAGSDYDELLVQAADVIFETKQASVSMLQRRLKLGYSRAARLIDQLEEVGLVGPFEGSKPRKILLTKQQWQEMQFVQGTAPAGDGGSAAAPGGTPEQTLFSEDDLF